MSTVFVWTLLEQPCYYNAIIITLYMYIFVLLLAPTRTVEHPAGRRQEQNQKMFLFCFVFLILNARRFSKMAQAIRFFFGGGAGGILRGDL